MWRGTMQAPARSSSRAVDGARRGTATSIESAPGHPGLLALALPVEGTDGRMRERHAARWSPLIAITGGGGSGRVRLTASGRAPDRLPAAIATGVDDDAPRAVARWLG